MTGELEGRGNHPALLPSTPLLNPLGRLKHFMMNNADACVLRYWARFMDTFSMGIDTACLPGRA